MNIKMTGVPACDAMLDFGLEGNIVPHAWYQTIVKNELKVPKPHLLAILVLADVVYWYRPIAVLDEITGNLIGYKKKFSNDLLQRNYAQIEKRFGCTKSQAKGAVDFLVRLGVITREFRNIEVNGCIYSNQMYLGLNVARLHELTYPSSKILGEGVGNLEGAPTQISDEGAAKKASPPEKYPKYTEITTKTSPEISVETSSLSRADKGESGGVSERLLEEDVKKQIGQLHELPKSYCNDLPAMTTAVKYLLENDFREQNGFSLEKDNREQSMMAAHRLMVSCLIDMCSTPGEQHYHKGSTTRELVVEQINRILLTDHGFLSGFAEAFCSAFLEEQDQRQIKNTYGYMKSMLWDYLRLYPDFPGE